MTTEGWRQAVRIATTGFSVVSCLALAICYAGRFDSFAAVTVFPAWAWAVPGLALAATALRRRDNRLVLLASGGWCLFSLAFAEEPWSLLRSLTTPATAPRAGTGGETLRVVSLNCNVGDPRAAAEVGRYRPDLVLLQESPGRGAVESLAKALFGPDAGILHGVDASLIARGRVVAADLTPRERSFFVQARVRLATGTEVEVVSCVARPRRIPLRPLVAGMLARAAQNRRARRAQLRAIAGRIAALPVDLPVILGGDFNAPQGDAVFRLLAPRLHDAFGEAGRGWGDTITNGLPFLRIDQVWTSGAFQAVGVVARATKHSDHRMVVCDLTIRREINSVVPR